VLAFNFGLRFVAVFLGCLRAGVIAVPVYPPNPATMKKSLQKLQLIVTNCEPKMILLCPLVNKLRTASKLRAAATGHSSGWPEIPYHCPDIKEGTVGGATKSSSAFGGWLGGGAGKKRNSFDEPTIKPDDVAFLQFTSGSTSDPKGVMITFKNLETNLDACIISMERVSWTTFVYSCFSGREVHPIANGVLGCRQAIQLPFRSAERSTVSKMGTQRTM